MNKKFVCLVIGIIISAFGYSAQLQKAKVNPLYNFVLQGETLFSTNELAGLTLKKITAFPSGEVNYDTAQSQFSSKKIELTAMYSNIKGVNAAIRTQNISIWSDYMLNMFLKAAAQQAEYNDAWAKAEAQEQKQQGEDEAETLKRYVDNAYEKANELVNFINNVKSSAQEASSSIINMANNLTQQLQDIQNSIDDNIKLLQLEIAKRDADNKSLIEAQAARAQAIREGDKEEEARQDAIIANLQSRIAAASFNINNFNGTIAKLSISQQAMSSAITRANSVADELATYIGTIEREVISLITGVEMATNNVKYIAKWLGVKDYEGTFIKPYDFKKDSTTEDDRYKNTTIFTMMNDMGYPVVSDVETLARWSTHLENTGKPKHYFLLGVGEGDIITNTYAYGGNIEHCGGKGATMAERQAFPPPKNWVDGDTIICTDGVYRVSDSSTNLLESLRALAKKSGFGDLFRRDSEVNMDDTSDPLNPTNTKNPRSSSFSKTDLTSIWNHIKPFPDNDVTEDNWKSEMGAMKSIEDLGKVWGSIPQTLSDVSLTNCFSLHNFWKSTKNSIPYVNEFNVGNIRTRELKWLITTNTFEFERYKTTEYDVAQIIDLKGFNNADRMAVPYKKKVGTGVNANYELDFISTLPITKIKSSDNTEITMANKNYPTNIVLEAASDTNLKFETENKSDGLHIKVHVYWK